MKAPSPPDPYKTAAAQAGQNQSTAISQQLLNMINQTTPYGSIDYRKTGMNSFMDPATGKMVNLPSYTARTRYSPEQMALLRQQQDFDKKFNAIALQQTGKIGEHLNTPYEYDPTAHTEWASGLYDELTGEENARQGRGMDAKLANMGLAPGSAAYNAEQSRLARDQSNSRNRFLLDSYRTGEQTALTNRNQPINEITALMSGGQVQQPQFQNTPNVGVNGVDLAGLVNSDYQSKLANYQSGMGGLFGLGSAALGMIPLLSDKRAKKNISEVGRLKDGTKLYGYEYKPEVGGVKGLMHIGVMAQEAKKKHPDAVSKGDDGLYRVDYAKIAQELAA